ncbi:hypothetical protein ACLOJK_037236 [Asimina triloba]
MGRQRRLEIEGVLITDRPLLVVSTILESAHRRQQAGRAGSFDGVLACVVVEVEDATGFNGLGKNRRSDDAVAKEVDDAPVVVDAWISPIGFGHKNQAIMMLPSGFKMGANRS